MIFDETKHAVVNGSIRFQIAKKRGLTVIVRYKDQTYTLDTQTMEMTPTKISSFNPITIEKNESDEQNH